MKLIASVDGSVCTSVLLNRCRVRASGSRASDAAARPAMKTTVPGMAIKFRLTLASSGVGCGTTGGIFRTARCRIGIGMLRDGKFRYLAIAGSPVTKINTDAMMNGDQPLSTVSTECAGTGIEATELNPGDPPIRITTGGFQILRNATITSSEKIADTMS